MNIFSSLQIFFTTNILVKRILADALFLLHSAIYAIVLFGWLVPGLWYIYMATLTVALVLQLLLGHCFLSEWEFGLRKAIDPTVDYDYSFSSYYMYKLTHRFLSEQFIEIAGFVFLIGSLIINIGIKFLAQ